MPALPLPRPSPCLFCAFAARSRPSAQRLLPRVQVAYRTAGEGGSKKYNKPSREALDAEYAEMQARNARTGHVGRNSFNPLKLSRDPLKDRLGSHRQNSMYEVVLDKLQVLREELSQPTSLESLQLTRETFEEEWRTFERTVNRKVKEGSELELEFLGGRQPMETRLRYMFYAQTCGGRFTQAELENQKEVADLRYPTEWYPATREIPRTVHLHVGPTNSGKTYHALKRLEEVDRGIYLGPLRLLAHEVYTRLNAKGKPCALVTGEEQRMPEGDTNMWSCTVEMAPLNTNLDVAVIDEIQMISHVDRGWAWTQAFLGVMAKEVHLCGEARTVPIIRELCALTGDKVIVHNYERLTPLEVAPRSLRGRLNSLEKGDCIVAFSVLGIHALRREVEKKTGKKCAIVYGSLPPETRAQQARLFNDPDNDYDYLVASDAIGMGLNLSIKRVIFESTMKSNGKNLAPLQISEIKQIAGRAGRYKTAHQAITAGTAVQDGAVEPETKPQTPTVGFVTTLEQLDYNYLKVGMSREAEPIRTAGLFPPSIIVERFANYFPPGTPFSYIMLRLHEISIIHPRFHLCSLKDQLLIADAIHTVKNLSIADRITICAAPTNMRDEAEKEFLREMAECIANGTSGNLLDLKSLPLFRMDLPPSDQRKYLASLESLHKMVVAYLWLSYRFPQVFTTRALANHTKQLVEDAIERTLMQFSWTQQAKEKLQMKRREAMRALEEEQNINASIDFGAGSREDERNIDSGSSDLPQEVADVLNDERSFAEGPPPTDDEGEYPSEELEVLEPEDIERLDEAEKETQAQTQSHVSPPPAADRSEASQSAA